MIVIILLSAIWGAANGWVERGIRAWLLGVFGANVLLGGVITALWQVALAFAPLFLVWAISPDYLSRVEIIVGVAVTMICYRLLRFIAERRHERFIRRIGLIGDKDL